MFWASIRFTRVMYDENGIWGRRRARQRSVTARENSLGLRKPNQSRLLMETVMMIKAAATAATVAVAVISSPQCFRWCLHRPEKKAAVNLQQKIVLCCPSAESKEALPPATGRSAQGSEMSFACDAAFFFSFILTVIRHSVIAVPYSFVFLLLLFPSLRFSFSSVLTTKHFCV